MFRLLTKVIAVSLVLTLAAPSRQAEARNNTGRAIAAAILGAVLIDAVPRNDRDNCGDNYRGNYRGNYRDYRDYRYQPQTQCAPRYYQNGRNYYQAPPRASGYVPNNLYRHNSGYGYDRFGTYRYDTGRINPYAPTRCR